MPEINWLWAIAILAVAHLAWTIILFTVAAIQERPEGGYPTRPPLVISKETITSMIINPGKVARRIFRDLAHVNPDEVPLVGIHIFCGRQGAGKTQTAVRLARDIAAKYPKAKCLANLTIRQGTGFEAIPRWQPVHNWGDVQAEEGRSTIVVLDEIQTWASSLQSHKVPPELLGLATQQRKRRMAILGTAQVPSRVAKPLREQCYRWYLCRKLLGSIHLVSVYDGDQLDTETAEFQGSPLRRYVYIPTDADRAAYETREIIADVDVTNYQMWQPTTAPSPTEKLDLSSLILNEKKP